MATNTRLHLIEPLGFRLNEKNLKRAGMDYWEHLDVTTYIDYRDFMEKNPGAKIYMATTKSPNLYTDVKYEPDCYIMFGKRKRRDSGRNPLSPQERQHPDSDDRRYPFTESWEFGCDRVI